MKFKPIQVENIESHELSCGKQLVCERCDGDTFIVYAVDHDHHHVQCTVCEAVYCNQKQTWAKREDFEEHEGFSE